MYIFLEAYLDLCHLFKIELLAMVNRWEPLNIFAKELNLGFLIDASMLLCVLTIYLVTKRYFKVRQINWQGS